MEAKQLELILLFIDHGDFESAANVYLNLTNRPKTLLTLLED
jgi:hypothetical protein